MLSSVEKQETVLKPISYLISSIKFTSIIFFFRSFKIPPQGKVNVYKTVNFEVKAVELTESDECVDEGEISLTPK